MKSLISIAFLLLIYEASFHLVKGQSDCTKLYNFLNGDSKDYANNCCSNFDIKCDNNGYITTILSLNSNKIDIASFPYFSRIEELHIYGMGLKEIPNSILKLTSLKFLSLFDNNIKELPNGIFDLRNLKTLVLSKNNIEIIPPSIQNLSQLEEIYLGNNKIKEFPNNLFNLSHLKKLKINDNPLLNTKIINFDNSPIEYCDFTGVNILCYEPHTCKTINFNNSELSDVAAENKFKQCTKEEINKIRNRKDRERSIIQDDVINNLNEGDKELNSPSNIKIGIILGCVSIIFIGILFILVKKRKSKRYDNSDSSFNDKLISRNIINNQSNNNSSSNINVTISDINNDNSNINSEMNKRDNYNIVSNSTATTNNNNDNSNSNDEINNKSNNISISNTSFDQSRNIMVNLSDMIQELYQEELYS